MLLASRHSGFRLVSVVTLLAVSLLHPRSAPAQPVATLAGHVVDPAGAPIAGAVVWVARLDGRVVGQSATDQGGAFSISVAAVPPFVLEVASPGFALARRSVSGPRPDLRIELEIDAIHEAITISAPERSDDTLRLASSLHETPRSLTIVDADRIRAQNFRSVSDALAFVPGMAVNSYRTGGYHFYARGYRMGPEETRVDGFAGINAGGRYSASLFGIERAVVLRGPAGLVYGSAGSPGGLINLVSKKPQDTAATRVDLRVGGYSGQGIGLTERGSSAVDLDSTGRVSNGGRVLYRALATFENASYFTRGVDDRNRYLNGSLTFRLDAAGRYSLTPLAQWTRFHRPPGGGIVVSPSTSLTTNDGLSGPIATQDLSSPAVNLSAGDSVDDTRQAGLELRAVVSRRLLINAAYRGILYDTSIDQFAPQVTSAAERDQLVRTHTVSRVQSVSDTERRYHNVDVNGAYELTSHPSWRSLLQAGVNGRLAATRSTAALGLPATPQSAIDIYTGLAAEPLIWAKPVLQWQDWTKATYLNTYLQSQTALDDGRWVMTVGVGYGQNTPSDEQTRKGDLTPNAAVVFNATPAVALYSSYSTSFNPVDPASEDQRGRRGAFKPSAGVNYEAGAKYDLPAHRGSLTLSIFKTEITNALVQSGPGDFNPNGNRYFAEAGTRRSRGVEISTELAPKPNWRLMGSLSWLDAIYLGGGPASAAATTAIPRSRAEKSPEWSSSLWTRYDQESGPFEGLGASLGVIWQAERLGGNGARTPSAPDPLLLPSFMRMDAGVFYRLNQRIEMALNVENMLDELILVSGTVGSNLEIASPRALTFRVGYRFE